MTCVVQVAHLYHVVPDLYCIKEGSAAAADQSSAVAGSVNMGSSDVLNIPQLLGRKTRPTDERFGLWLLLENLDNLVTDIGNINYTENATLLSRRDLSVPTAITEPFCDNIMLIKICDQVDCYDQLDKGRTVMLKKDMCGSFNSYLRSKFGDFVSARHGVKAKLPFLLHGGSGVASKRLLEKIDKEALESISRKYTNPVAVPFKVELADVKLDVLLDELPAILQQLRADDYYLLDLDITQDFAGIFNKVEMCDFLVSNHDFRLEGKCTGNSNVIVDNDTTVGIDCLTWLTSNCRVKIYNKFICQITSPGVNKDIGNHIIDFIRCPDTRLRETFTSSLARDHGVTRLEATIYNYQMDRGFDPVQDCLSVLNENKRYLQCAPLYSVPISSMWLQLTSALQNSCCVVFNDILQFVYWGNKNTRKLTGVQVNLPDTKDREKLINYVLSAYSFNYVPVNYVEIRNTDSSKDDINITHKSYIKAGETYFSQSRTLFSTIAADIDMADLGLIPTSNVIPQVLRRRVNGSNRLKPYPIKEITPLSAVNVLCVRKRKMEMEQIEVKKRKQDYIAKTTALRDEYKLQLEKEEAIAAVQARFTYGFKHRVWRNLATTGTYRIFAFTVNRKGEWTRVGVLAEINGMQDVYYIKGCTKNVFIKLHSCLDLLKENGYIVSKCGELDVIHLSTEKPFAELKTDGITRFNEHSFAKIVNLKFYTEIPQDCVSEELAAYTQDDVECYNNYIMQEIRGKIKVRECSRLETLPEGAELIVKSIKELNYRKKRRFVMEFENVQSLFLSNYWLEKELEESNVDLSYKIKIKLDVLKVTPNKNKERVVFCV